MKKLVKVLFAVVLTVGVSFGANAQSLKVGHVDFLAILQIMPEFTKAYQDLETYKTELESEVQAMLVEYQNKLQDYQANKETMSNLIRQSKEKEIIDLETRINDFQNVAQQALSEKEEALLTPVTEKLQSTINEVGQELGFTYVFNKGVNVGAVVYIGENAIDITADVKAKLGL